MYALSLTVFCALAVLGNACRERLYERECCKNIRGIRECKQECQKVWDEKDSRTKLLLALSLPKVCPSHLVVLWKCLNSSIKGLHLYAHPNLLKEGKSCCLLGIDASCRKACFLSTNIEDLRKSCKPKDEDFLLRCIERNEASRTCCFAEKRKCERACQNVFASNKEPTMKKIKLVKRNCIQENRKVYKCVKNSNVTLPKPDHQCCKKATSKRCQVACREAMASKKPWDEKVSALQKDCFPSLHSGIWRCFLTHSKTVWSHLK